MEGEEKILYDVLIPYEWQEIADSMSSSLPVRSHSLWKTLAALTRACCRFVVKRIKHPLSSFRHSPIPPSAFVGLVNSQLPWQLAISNDGQLLGVLKEEEVEIRSIEDDFESVCAVCSVPADVRPQWRRMVWNGDANLLAVGTSYGSVAVFSSAGHHICAIPEQPPPSQHDRAALAKATTGLSFLPAPRDSQDCCSLLAILRYGGLLDTYQLLHDGTTVLLHSFSLLARHPAGTSSMLYHDRLNLLIVAGCGPAEGADSCISGWRMLDSFPHWAPMAGQEEKKQKRFFDGVVPSSNGVVFQLSLSPSGQLLASIDSRGQLSVREVPSLKLRHLWPCNQLPVSEVTSSLPSFGTTTQSRKGLPMPLDVSWWSDEALILLNTAGEVTVPSILSLDNLLGDAPEEGMCISPAYNGQFFMLECKNWGAVVARGKLPSLSSEEGNVKEEVDMVEEEEDEEEEEFSLSRASAGLIKQVLYFLSESERFRPPAKKAKTVVRQYRLACLKSMPPEECYERKMLQEEYGEALMLAQQYGLDCDLVFQKQWEAHPVTMASIQDYLSKVSKRSWVLQECLSRAPQECDTARELLLYGLIRTSFEELKEAGDDVEVYEAGDSIVSVETESITLQIEEEICTWDKLSPDQASICQHRHILLMFLDRLATYEEILGGPSAADELYSEDFYLQFRSSNLVSTAISYAQESDWQALEVLLTYHGALVLPHRLPLLSSFPETTSPLSYRALLPAVSEDGDIEAWEQDRHSEPDWVESKAVRSLCSLPIEAHANSGSFIYEQFPEWTKYESPSSGAVLTEWYVERAAEIEELSGQVNNAVTLIELGIERGVKGLESLHHELLTLHTLVYQCNADCRLSLHRLRQMSELEIMQLMMKESHGEDFVMDLCNRAVPFLERLEASSGKPQRRRRRRAKLLEDYLTSVAKDDLEPCLAVFRQSKGKGPCGSLRPILTDSEEEMSLALKCIYVCERTDQLGVADQILECLPVSAAHSSGVLSRLHAGLDKLEDHLSAADILLSYGVQKPIHYIRDSQDNCDEAEQLLVKLTRVASRQQPPLTEAGWKNLLQHLLSLKSRVFSCVDQPTCYRVFTEGLLCSGASDNILLASHMLTLSSSSSTPSSSSSSTSLAPKFNYRLSSDTSLQLVLSAAREYFNSAANLTDRDMDLARTCLVLFPSPPPPVVQQELNLIASLGILDDFGVTILPVQIRLCEQRLDIVKKVLHSSNTAYRRHEKILHLSRLLGLDELRTETGDAEVGVARGRSLKLSPDRGKTVILLASVALEKADVKLSHTLCGQLMEAQFAEAWDLCRRLAACDQLRDMKSRMDFLDFALSHCPPEEIGALLEERGALEARMLCSKFVAATPSVKAGVDVGGAGPAQGGRAGAVQQLVGRGVQRIVSTSAGVVQHYFGQKSSGSVVSTDGQSAAEAIRECSQLLCETCDSYQGERKEKVLLRPARHPFYFCEYGQESTDEFYTSIKPPKTSNSLALSQAALRTAMLSTTLTGGGSAQSCEELLLRLAEENSETDTHLILAYLLSLAKPGDADKLFSKMVPDKFSLFTAVYYCCLQLYAMAGSCQTLTVPHPYLHSPLELVDHVICHVTPVDELDLSENCHSVLKLLRKCQELLTDHTQAEVLRGLGLGIDVERFTQDSQYKHSTILSLARTADSAAFSTALSLAKRHSMAEWEVFITLLDWLLTCERLKYGEIQQKLADLDVLQVLLADPQKTADSLMEYTYHNLPPSKYSVLLLYYTVLQQCADRGAQLKEGLNADTHVQLLKKFKAALPGIDYKSLMNGADPLHVLAPVLSSSNVHVVAKVASKIPCQQQAGGTLSPGLVYGVFAEKLFWGGDGKQPKPDSPAEWTHRFEACHDYLARLSPDQFRQFVCIVLLSFISLELSLETRIELMRRCVRFSKKRAKPTSTPSSTDASDKPSDTRSYEVVCKELKTFLMHLENLHGTDLVRPEGISEVNWSSCITEFDLSNSEPDKVHRLCLRMAREGMPLSAVDTLLSLAQAVYQQHCTTREVVQKALSLSKTKAGDGTVVLDLEQMETVLLTVHTHESAGGSLVSSTDVLEVLWPLCDGGVIQEGQRRTLLTIMEKYLFLSQEDTELLLLYQTQSVLAQHFSTPLSVTDLSSAEQRQQLFSKLLQEATTTEQLLTMATLLESWTESGSSLMSCWIGILYALADRPEPAAQSAVVSLRASLQQLPAEVEDKLFDLLLARNTFRATKFSLVSKKEHLLQRALERLKDSESTSQFDVNLLEMVLQLEQVPAIVNKPLYSQLCSYLADPKKTEALDRRLFSRILNCSEDCVAEMLCLVSPSERVMKAVHQLNAAGMRFEAGSLRLSASLFHPALQTLNSVLAFAHHR